MKSKDLLANETKQLAQALTNALENKDEAAVTQAFTDFQERIAAATSEDIQAALQQMDGAILTQRGKRMATSQEVAWVQKLAQAAGATDPRQALVDLSKGFPETIMETVIEEIKATHPLLAEIDFVPAGGATKMIINADGVELATWGALNSAVSKELAGAIDTIDVATCKLSAFLPVPKDSMRFSNSWLLNYVILLLVEAIARGAENAVINGTGNSQPIGMKKNLAGSVVEGVYPDKSATALTSLTPTAYNAVVGTLAAAPNGETRVVPEVILICNPVDYITKIMPATTVRAADGSYNTGIFPFPTKAIQSDQMASGYAIMGIAKKYFMSLNGPKEGAIEYSDENQFLEDNRVYLTRLYGNGRPKDNTAFVYLDISGLVAPDLEVVIKSGNVDVEGDVSVVNYEQQPKALTVTSAASADALGKTAISIAQSKNAGNSYKYKTAATIELPNFVDVLTTGWTAWNGTAEITATTGHKICIVEVDSANKCRAVGEATVTSKDS